jgi:hypothetical protein
MVLLFIHKAWYGFLRLRLGIILRSSLFKLISLFTATNNFNGKEGETRNQVRDGRSGASRYAWGVDMNTWGRERYRQVYANISRVSRNV